MCDVDAQVRLWHPPLSRTFMRPPKWLCKFQAVNVPSEILHIDLRYMSIYFSFSKLDSVAFLQAESGPQPPHPTFARCTGDDLVVAGAICSVPWCLCATWSWHSEASLDSSGALFARMIMP